MMLRLVRDQFFASTTLGVLTVDGKDFGFTCEDEDRGLDWGMDAKRVAALKVKKETAIPTGQYRVRVTWSERFQKSMPQVMNVLGFQGIRIHPGNKESHTEGCILPGLHRVGEEVRQSKDACVWLYHKIDEVLASGEDVWLEITRDADAWAAFRGAGA